MRYATKSTKTDRGNPPRLQDLVKKGDLAAVSVNNRKQVLFDSISWDLDELGQEDYKHRKKPTRTRSSALRRWESLPSACLNEMPSRK